MGETPRTPTKAIPLCSRRELIGGDTPHGIGAPCDRDDSRILEMQPRKNENTPAGCCPIVDRGLTLKLVSWGIHVKLRRRHLGAITEKIALERVVQIGGVQRGGGGGGGEGGLGGARKPKNSGTIGLVKMPFPREEGKHATRDAAKTITFGQKERSKEKGRK